MRVVSLAQGFGLHNLRLEERPEPSFGRRDVLVRVRAVSLNARDVMMARGTYNRRQKLPLVPCSDAAGEVVARGEEVTEWELGDRVCPIFAPLWQAGELTREAQRNTLGGPLDGTLSEYLVADAEALVRVPTGLNFVEAACLPCASVTAYRALVELGRMQAGQWLVCQGTGGVSLAALGIARALGVRTIVTSRKAEKLARLTALGAEHVLDVVQNPEWGKAVRELTSGQGAHQVLELGGAQTLANSVRALRLGGTASIIGVLSGALPELDLRPILMQGLRLQGVFVGSRATFLGLLELVQEHALRPQIDRVFAFEDTRAAFEYAENGEQVGKVAIVLA